MNKRENKKKIDIEAKLFMALLNLKEEKNKKYSVEECKKNVAYLFENYEEFKTYFELNGFADISEDLLEICRMKTTRKGTIITLKGLCDYTIRKHNLMHSHTIDSSTKEIQFDVLTVPCDRAFVVVTEKAEKFRVSNLIEEGPVLKKTRKLNEK